MYMPSSPFIIFNLHVGEGMGELSLADRATIANMSPEYGATMGFFPVDHVTLQYLKLTGRSDETVSSIFHGFLYCATLPNVILGGLTYAFYISGINYRSLFACKQDVC